MSHIALSFKITFERDLTTLKFSPGVATNTSHFMHFESVCQKK